MTKDELIELLKDDDVKNIIIDIVNNLSETKALVPSIEKDLNKEIEVLNKIIKKIKKALKREEETSEYLEESKEKLEFELSSMQTQKIELNRELRELRKFKEELLSSNKHLKSDVVEVKSSNTKLNKSIEFYRSNFEDDLRVYEIYQTLNSSTKSSLAGIFKDSSLKGFIACGVQDKNISSLWDYIQNELRDNSNPDIANLIKIFDFLFEKYLMAYPIYQIQDISIGDKFDTDDYIRDNRSEAVSGDISQIILKGWINSKTNKIMRKSVVKIG